jgi:hypothetical protein
MIFRWLAITIPSCRVRPAVRRAIMPVALQMLLTMPEVKVMLINLLKEVKDEALQNEFNEKILD